MIKIQPTDKAQGLSSNEAQQRLLQYGPNLVEEKQQHPLVLLIKKFWAPVPWMLEITIILQCFLGKMNETLIMTALLIFNAVLSFFQEERANKALQLLKQHLSIKARVLRDGQWQLISALALVPDDIVYLRMGDMIPADIRLHEGRLLIDQSILTGEALPIESTVNMTVYTGSLIKRGEATGKVIATGKNTFYGKTAELVKIAKSESHITTLIFTVVKYLVTMDVLLAIAVFIDALISHLPLTDIIPYVLILLVASIPIALPVTFTLATALGAMQLTKRGVLVTHLLAIEDAAMMDVVCCDKTGTITQNKLQVAQLKPFSAYSVDDLLYFAALACDEATQDPIDKAILTAAHARQLMNVHAERIELVPFDPAFKRSEAVYILDHRTIRVVKGAPDAIKQLVFNSSDMSGEIMQMASQGCRVLAVAMRVEDKITDDEQSFNFVGLIALNDPPRDDSKTLIQRLKELGLRIIMVTGDSLATAKTIASMVGIGHKACLPEVLKQTAKTGDFDVFASMFPEDKYRLVQNLQKSNHTVGMTGDGVNDAPALKQAHIGIAVSNATDIAKAAASIVLTQSGLGGILSVVESSRRIYQRMLTYLLNKIIKSFEIAIFLSIGVILTGQFIITPLLIVLLLFTNDFVTMSIATDNVSFSQKPERWQISKLMIVGGLIAALMLLLSFSVFYIGRDLFHLPLAELQTLVFVMLVFTGQGNIYLIRERKHFWHSKPGKWLVIASVSDIIIVSLFAIKGIFMVAISPILIIGLLMLIIIYLFMIDFLKIRVFEALSF